MQKKLTFFITNSYGEIDEAAKIIDLQDKEYKINIIFFQKQLKNHLNEDSILKKKIKLKNINIFFPQNIIKKIFISIKSIIVSKEIYVSDDTYVKYSIFFNIIIKIFFKEKIIFKHTASPYYLRKTYPLPRNFMRDYKTQVIVFNEIDYNFFKKCGYKFIEKKKENKRFNDLVISSINSKIKFKRFVLILSYRIHQILPFVDKLSHYRDIFEILKKKILK